MGIDDDPEETGSEIRLTGLLSRHGMMWHNRYYAGIILTSLREIDIVGLSMFGFREIDIVGLSLRGKDFVENRQNFLRKIRDEGIFEEDLRSASLLQRRSLLQNS